MACTKETVKSNGLNVWYDGSPDSTGSTVDIVAVQGLRATPFYTWVKKNKNDEKAGTTDKHRLSRLWKGKQALSRNEEDGPKEVMWLRDLLPNVFPSARIATYSYESDWRDSKIKTSLRQCADQFLAVISHHRQGPNERERPLILIGHSFGGVVIQQALVTAVHHQDYQDICLSVAGITLLGAPIYGSNVAIYGKRFAKLVGLDSTLLDLLVKGEQDLYDLSRDFWGSHSGLEIVCFYEHEEAKYGPLKKKIVDQQSATLVGKRLILLRTDHSGLNKFSGLNDENFQLLLPELRKMVNDGPSIVLDRYRRKKIANSPNKEPAGNSKWMVPGIVNNLFTGRNDILNVIEHALLLIHVKRCKRANKFRTHRERKEMYIRALEQEVLRLKELYGSATRDREGGQGKSEVCIKAAHMMRESFWGVFWIDVGNPSTAERDFIAAAKATERTVEGFEEARYVFANIRKTWLLVLDNADDPTFDYQIYFPSGDHGAVIMTSRITACNRYNTVGSLALESLDDGHSVELLFEAAQVADEARPCYEKQAREIVNLLGSHTLALVQAGAYIAKGHCQLDKYPDVYSRQRERLMQYRPTQARSRYSDVYATFETSADALKRSESDAAKDALDLLRIISMLHYSILSLQLFEDAWETAKAIQLTDNTEQNDLYSLYKWHVAQMPEFMVSHNDEWDSYRLLEAINLLESLSLVTRHSGDRAGRISMHPLTHAWAKDRQELDQQGKSWVATGAILALSPPTFRSLQGKDGYLPPHLHAYLSIKIRDALSMGPPNMVLTILVRSGQILEIVRDDVRLDALLQEIIVELDIDSNEPSQQYLPIFDLIAKSLINKGRLKGSVELLSRIVKIRETALAEDHPSRLASQHELAGAYHVNGQVKQAVELLEHVVEIKATVLVEDHPSRLASQHELARAYHANGQVKQAVELLEHVVEIRATVLAENHPSRLASQHELAGAYHANGQVKQAVELLEHVVEIKATVLAEDHPHQLVSQQALAQAYKATFESGMSTCMI